MMNLINKIIENLLEYEYYLQVFFTFKYLF